jgi:hypothetical protein
MVPKRAMTKASTGSEEGDDEGVSDGELMVPRTEPTTAMHRANSRVPKRATTKAS